MKRTPLCWWIPLLAAVLYPTQIHAQGTISWNANYPKTGGIVAGSIDIKGTYTLNAGWSLTSTTLTLRVWQEDGKLTEYQNLKTNMDKTWADKDGVSGLVSGTEYWLTAQIEVTNGTDKVILVTKPKKAKAK